MFFLKCMMLMLESLAKLAQKLVLFSSQLQNSRVSKHENRHERQINKNQEAEKDPENNDIKLNSSLTAPKSSDHAVPNGHRAHVGRARDRVLVQRG